MMVGYVLHVRKAIGVVEFDFCCVVGAFNNRPATIFLSKSLRFFEKVKSERAAANSKKSATPRASAIIFKNSQIYGIKNMFAGSIITMNKIQHYFCLLLMNQKLINF